LYSKPGNIVIQLRPTSLEVQAGESAYFICSAAANWDNSCTTTKPSGVYYNVYDETILRYYTTHRAGQKLANPWELCDMHGNVLEWCLDWYSGPLPGGSVTDAKGIASGSFRVIRGGSWLNLGWDCRSALRFRQFPSNSHSSLGFRVVLAASQ
jgi:formylglycine-generating enzyme required for sulfatase activity